MRYFVLLIVGGPDTQHSAQGAHSAARGCLKTLEQRHETETHGTITLAHQVL